MSDGASRWIVVQPLGTQVEARAGESVLDALRRSRVPVFFRCTRGGCGVCKMRLLAGQLAHGRYSKAALTDEERLDGFFLSCQCVPVDDVEISLVDERDPDTPLWKRRPGGYG